MIYDKMCSDNGVNVKKINSNQVGGSETVGSINLRLVCRSRDSELLCL